MAAVQGNGKTAHVQEGKGRNKCWLREGLRASALVFCAYPLSLKPPFSSWVSKPCNDYLGSIISKPGEEREKTTPASQGQALCESPEVPDRTVS